MTSVLYYLLFGFTWIISLIPFPVLYRIADLLYLFIYYAAGYRKKTVFDNLRSSFPEKSDKEITQLAKAFYRHFCDFLLETIRCIRIPADKLDRRMKFLNPEVFKQLTANNQDFALVSAHYNNWEWLMNLPLKMAHRFLVIYRPLTNKVVDRLSLYMRGRHKPVMIPMESIYREGLKCRSENRLFSIWFLADQRPPKNSKCWTWFLNHETAFFEGVEKISRKLSLAVVFMDVQKVRRGYYEVTLKMLFENAAHTKENEVTLACIKAMEDEIIKRPEFWLWSHKRFKHSRPENIKLIAS
jgi:Kdo2-lipid IVA lauroyltransferase/acyltransferase